MTTPLAAPLRSTHLHRMRYEPRSGELTPLLPAVRPVPPPPTLPTQDRDAVQAALTGVVRLALEVLDDKRPVAHLAPHFDAAALRYWRAAAAQRRERGVRAPTRVRRIVLGLPHNGAAELAVVCAIDGRVRALAARFEQPRPSAPWRCRAVRLG